MKINENSIYNMCCLKGMDLMIEQGLKVDAIITDPPYGTTACKWDSVIPFDDMWDRLNNIVSDNSVVALFGNEPYTSELIHSNIKNFKYRMDWNKKIPSGMSYAKYRPMQQTEDIVIFEKNNKKLNYNPQKTKRDKPIKGGGMGQSDTAFTKGYKPLKKTYEYKNPITLIEFMKIRKGSLHPTQKPVELIEYLIKTYTNENDIVLDFTIGSGTTAIACMNTNRRFIGFELDNGYYDIAIERINNHGN